MKILKTVLLLFCVSLNISCKKVSITSVDNCSKEIFLTDENLIKWNEVTIDSFHCQIDRSWKQNSKSSMFYRDKIINFNNKDINKYGRKELFEFLQCDTVFVSETNKLFNEIILFEFKPRMGKVIKYFIIVKDKANVMLYFYDIHSISSPKRFGPVKIGSKSYFSFLDYLQLPINEFETKKSYCGEVYVSRFNADGIFLYNYIGYNFNSILMESFRNLNPNFVDMNIER